MRIRRQAEADGFVRKVKGKEQIIDTMNQVVATAFSAAPAGKTCAAKALIERNLVAIADVALRAGPGTIVKLFVSTKWKQTT